MFRNTRKQGDAGLGQAVAYFTMKGYDVALPLTDSADWDLIVELEDGLKRVQVKTSHQLREGVEVFDASVKGGNQSFKTVKGIDKQKWDYIFLHHLETGRQAFIPKEAITSKGQINLSERYSGYIL